MENTLGFADTYVWQPLRITYAVTFISNGGSEVAAQTVTANDFVVEPTNPTRAGYRFIGWFSDEVLATLYDFKTPMIQNLVLYAGWEKDPVVTEDATIKTSVSENKEENATNREKSSLPKTGEQDTLTYTVMGGILFIMALISWYLKVYFKKLE